MFLTVLAVIVAIEPGIFCEKMYHSSILACGAGPGIFEDEAICSGIVVMSASDGFDEATRPSMMSAIQSRRFGGK